MPEAGRYDVDRDAGEQQGRGVQVTKIMQPGVRQALIRLSECLVVAVDQLGHERGDGIGIKGLAPFADEYQAVAVAPG